MPANGANPARLLVATNEEKHIGRQHLLLEPLPACIVRVSNRSPVPLPRGDGAFLPPNTSVELTAPFSLLLPGRSLSVTAGDSIDEFGVQGLDQQTLGPADASDLSRTFRPPPALSAGQVDDLVHWLQTTLGVLQSTVGSSDFLPRAAAAVVQIVGLHSGRVLLLEKDEWKVAAQYGVGTDAPPWQPSQRVLARVRAEKRTFWQRPQQATATDSASLAHLRTVVAAPLLDGHGDVIGALYGEERSRDGGPASPSGGKLEALLVDLLACGVATGLARQEKERSALAARIQFEQFFTRDLAEQLARDPALLKGADRPVTLLFCDVRGFSAFSEKLGPERTMDWIGDVMGVLSECVLREEGVLVDYIGDEMLAMWGAPREQPDQAERAARAGLAMLAGLPELNRRWLGVLGQDMSFGIGINTGVARVGNTGSRFKFKYGPLGNTVNLASRVQGLTKYLGCRLLATRATRERLGDDFIARRVVKTRVVNIKEPVDLYEVEASGGAERLTFFRASEAALEALEAGDFADAARRSGVLLPDHSGDGPLLLVLSRASTALVNRGGGFDPVWVPPGK
jgi:adenylate cyclase